MPGVEDAGLMRWRRSRAAALIALPLAFAMTPFLLLGLAFWAASGPWEFSGGGIRHWLFVKGSTVGRLGLVDASGEPVHYVVRLEEGTDPGEIFASYDSQALPSEVVRTYAGRCRALAFEVKERPVAADAAEGKLVCAGNPAIAMSDDVFVSASRAAGAQFTEVRLTAGPGLTSVYDF